LKEKETTTRSEAADEARAKEVDTMVKAEEEETNEIKKDSKMTSCLRSWLSPGGIVASVLKNSLPSPVSVVPCSQALLKNVLLPHECQQIRGYNNRWMREDDRNRALVCAVAPERRILEGIQVAKGIIPEDLRDQAKKDLRDWSKYPRRTCPELLVKRCVITGRTRGIVRPWRVSRFVFREEADHGKLCGVKRAMWGTNNMKGRRCVFA